MCKFSRYLTGVVCFLCFFVTVAKVIGDEQTKNVNNLETPEDYISLIRHVQNEGDQGKTLVLYKQLIERFPESASAQQAKEHFLSLIASQESNVSPQPVYNQISAKSATTSWFLLYDILKDFLNWHLSEKMVAKTKNLIKRYFADNSVRFRVEYVAPVGESLRYTGPVAVGGVILHGFSIGEKKFLKNIGEHLLYYTVAGYDNDTQSITLVPFNDEPYKLFLSSDYESYRFYLMEIGHVQLDRKFKAYLYPEYIDTDEGTHLFGFCKEDDENNVFFDFERNNSFHTIKGAKNAIAELSGYVLTDAESVIEKQYVISGQTSRGVYRYLGRLDYFLSTFHWYESTVLSCWMLSNEMFAAVRDRVKETYDQIEEKVLATTYGQRLSEKGQYLLDNGYFFLGWNTLSENLSNDPAGISAVDAYNRLVMAIRQQEHNLYVTELKAAPFPVTFMGYNKVSEEEELFQLNYKNRSYFIEKGQSKGGFTILDTAIKTVEKMNPQLNAVEKIPVRWIQVRTATPKTVTVSVDQPLIDQDKVYIEIKDLWSGKVYPGYMLLDKISVRDGRTLYGIIKESGQNYIVYEDLEKSSYTIVEKRTVTSLNQTTKEDLLQELENRMGKIVFSELKNYYTVETRDQEAETQSVVLEEEPASQKEVVRESENEQPSEKQAVEQRETVVQAKKGKLEKQQVVPDPFVQKQDELKIRESKITLKKQVIKVLALMLLLWLGYMAYKLVRSFR